MTYPTVGLRVDRNISGACSYITVFYRSRDIHSPDVPALPKFKIQLIGSHQCTSVGNDDLFETGLTFKSIAVRFKVSVYNKRIDRAVVHHCDNSVSFEKNAVLHIYVAAAFDKIYGIKRRIFEYTVSYLIYGSRKCYFGKV